jgi:hypothetical protein
MDAAEAEWGLKELRPTSGRSGPWLVDLVQTETNGGRIAIRQLGAIESHPEARALQVSGLDQPAFEELVRSYGRQFEGIYFWKCPRIEDLSPLEDLPGLRYLGYYWNQRATRLWDLSRNPQLRGLQLEDFTRVRDIGPLSEAKCVEELVIGNAVWPKWVIGSLRPLGGLGSLVSLTLQPKSIEDGRVQPLATLRGLREFRFPPNLFTTPQVAWLRAHMPGSVAPALMPTWDLRAHVVGSIKLRGDTLIVGKRKPLLDSTREGDKIRQYELDFWKMVDEFSRHPELEPDGPVTH